MTEKYWASEGFSDLGGNLEQQVDRYYKHLQISGRLALWQSVNYMYHQTYYTGSGMRKAGANSEYDLLTVNHFRNIIQHMVNMVSGEELSFQPKTTNTDSKSQKQAILSRNILEYYTNERRIDRKLRNMDRYALMYGESFVQMKWEHDVGEISDYAKDKDGALDKNKPIQEGDIRFSVHTPDNVIRDVDVDEYDNSDWIIVRESMNKWNLAARFPEIADEILAITTKKTSAWDEYIGDTETYLSDVNQDQIEMYTFYHKKTPAMPNGRMVEFLNADTMLTDAPLPHKSIPVFRETPEEQENSAFGTTIAYDLVAIQEALNTLHSTIVTNQSAFGVATILVPKNSDYRFESLSEGLSVVEYKEGPGARPPETLDLLNTKAEIFNYAKELVTMMEQVSGVNSVVRGAPAASLESGSALALVHSTAIKFNQSRHLSYVAAVEDVGTNIITFLKQFALTKRVISITGKSNRNYLKSFNQDDISEIDRVSMEVQNPLMASTAGRVQIAENLIRTGVVMKPEEYLSVINTGRLEPLIEHETAELMLVRAENEALAEGEPQVAILTDSHLLHIKEHKAVLASPDARKNPELVELALSHIQEHMNILADPANASLLQMLGQPQLPPPQAAAAPPGGGQVGEPQSDGSPDMPSLPEMPSVPGGGEYDPQTGQAAPQGMPKKQYAPSTGV